MKERIAYLDFVKGLAILLVCIGHANWVSPRGMECPLVQWIYTFHMPLFMLMCGFFSKGLFDLDAIQFIKKECRRLVVPIIVFTGLRMIIMTLAGANVWRDELIGGMWFLRCLLFCDIIVYIGKKLCKRNWITCIIPCVVLLAIPYGDFLRTNYFLLIYWTGYFWRKYYRMYESNVLWITIVSGFICVIIGIIGEPQIIHWGEWQLLMKYYFSGIGWSMFIIGCAFYLVPFVKSSLMIKLGQITLYVYGINSLLGNGLIKQYVNWKSAIAFDWLLILIFGIVECSICCLFVWIYKVLKNKCGCILSY